jgi:hypothetical protein
MKTLKQLVDEFKCLSEDNKTECEKRFEKVLFGDPQNLLGTLPSEPDTKREHDIYRQLRSWFGKSQSDPSTISAFRDMEGCKKYFKEQLAPPYGKRVYRGTSIPIEEWKKLRIEAEANDKKYEYKGSKWIRWGMPYEYKAKSKLQSWTLQISTAAEFSGKSARDITRQSVVIETFIPRSTNDWLLSLKFSNKMNAMKESEIIRLTNKPLKCFLLIK